MPVSAPHTVLYLTINRRLARELEQAYAARQQAGGAQVWETPLILSWNAWLERCWEEAASALLEQPDPNLPVLLNPAQEQAVWEQVISDSTQGRDLLQISATARQARAAWETLQFWELALPGDETELNEDNKAFAAWAAAFAETCQQQGWLASAQLAPALAKYFKTGRLACPAQIWLAGFGELTPQQQTLLQRLKQTGAQVNEWPLEREAEPMAAQLAAADAETEIRLAARWARGLLENGQRGRIGVVIPRLETLRGQVARIFDEVLHPRAPGQTGGARLYNLSLGQALSEYPLVHTALAALSLAYRPLPLEQLGGWLRAPFLAGAQEEFSRRALFDAWLRDHVQEEELDSGQCLYWLRRAEGIEGNDAGPSPALPHTSPVLRSRLETWRAACADLPARLAPSAWAESFSRLLGLLGWPDQGRPLDSAEYQCLLAWRELLARFSSLDRVWPALPPSRALSQLRRMAQEQIFQPQSEIVPVQILGELEATGLRFQALWIAGLHDEAWPPPPKPNPFLPLKLQRRHNLPRASAEREWQVAARITESLLRAAPSVLASWPRFDGERALRPSPLLRGLPEIALDTLPLAEDSAYWHSQLSPRALETFSDSHGPALSGEHATGGSALFQRQAECPFRAFAEFRLAARPLSGPRANAAPRGQWVHRALEQIWRALNDSATLAGLAETELETLIAEHAGLVVEDNCRNRGERFRALEKARLARLLRRWLAEEKQRAPFRIVALEHETQVAVGGLTITAKLDRLDQLSNGSKVLIDYKTGNQAVGPQQWEGERPDEPQLMLYSLPLAGQLAAVLFARLRPEQARFTGLAREDGLVPGVKAFAGDWDAALQAWAGVLERLAAAFRAGEATVAPKKPGTCRYCCLPELCRIAAPGGEEIE